MSLQLKMTVSHRGPIPQRHDFNIYSRTEQWKHKTQQFYQESLFPLTLHHCVVKDLSHLNMKEYQHTHYVIYPVPLLFTAAGVSQLFRPRCISKAFFPNVELFPFCVTSCLLKIGNLKWSCSRLQPHRCAGKCCSGQAFTITGVVVPRCRTQTKGCEAKLWVAANRRANKTKRPRMLAKVGGQKSRK